MSTANTIVKVSNKPDAAWDYSSTLQWLWRSDKSRDWSIYGTEQFRRFWDIHVKERRSR